MLEDVDPTATCWAAAGVPVASCGVPALSGGGLPSSVIFKGEEDLRLQLGGSPRDS